MPEVPGRTSYSSLQSLEWPYVSFRNFLLLNSLSSFRSLFSCWETSTHILPCGEDSRRDGRGRVLEEFTAENDLIILKSGEQTFVHSTYHSTSAIDLAVASPSIVTECSWAAHNDLCGSDHFPIFLTLTSNFNSNVNTTSFDFQKADRNRFGDPCRLSLDDSVASIEQFSSKLLDAARSSIPFH
ncbi:RNA-directed DNA polymerase from mobile element jockey [Plakobranchus ocellatus]|uniref:RNA-directed DNA polymerase from mobile element jockey n=1 Tax=Plakobranchus ocellatus TaxID=259542 RepID=A0AAV3XYE1_9GAST|nr:RNA-directed DNA polymerase from mobile element jockey [Plakobranchus ocellatus]